MRRSGSREENKRILMDLEVRHIATAQATLIVFVFLFLLYKYFLVYE